MAYQLSEKFSCTTDTETSSSYTKEGTPSVRSFASTTKHGKDRSSRDDDSSFLALRPSRSLLTLPHSLPGFWYFSRSSSRSSASLSFKTASSLTAVMTNSNTSVSGYLGRFLDHVGKHVVTLMKERVLQDWLNEIKAQLDSSTLLIDYGPEDLARIFEDILTLIQQKKSEGLKINGFSKKITEKAHILAKTSIEREWLGTSSTKHRAVQLDTVEVLFDYFCDLYWALNRELKREEILQHVLDCALKLISSSDRGTKVQDKLIPLLSDIIVTESSWIRPSHDTEIVFTRNCVVTKLGCILWKLGPDPVTQIVQNCGIERIYILSHVIKTLGPNEYLLSIQKELAILVLFSPFARHSPSLTQELFWNECFWKCMAALQLPVFRRCGMLQVWETLLTVDHLRETICEATNTILKTIDRTRYSTVEQAGKKDEYFMGNVCTLMQNNDFRRELVKIGGAKAVFDHLTSLEGYNYIFDLNSNQRLPVLSFKILMTLDSTLVDKLARQWLWEGISSNGSYYAYFSWEIFCWAIGAFAMAVHCTPQLAVYLEKYNVLERLLQGREKNQSLCLREKFNIALEQCWHSLWGRTILREKGFTDQMIYYLDCGR